MKSDCDFTNENDGTFFMSIEDFKEEYGSTTICACRDNYVFEWAEHGESSTGNTTSFTLGSEGQVNITLSQVAARCVSKKFNYMPFLARILLAKQGDDGALSYEAHTFGAWKADTVLTANLQPGTYVVWSHIDWDSTKPIRQYSLSTYAPEACNPQEQDLGRDVHE